MASKHLNSKYNIWSRSYFMDGDLGGDWGDGPQKLEVGTAHASAPNISKSSVIG